MVPSFLISAPASGSGKTTIARGLMALFVQKGKMVQPFKCGPDYIDTKFHAAVCGRSSINFDTFMASEEHVRELFARYGADADVCIVEGMMGLFDGYDRDKGSSAEISSVLDIPVVLVVDARSAAYSVAALLTGFLHFSSTRWGQNVIGRCSSRCVMICRWSASDSCRNKRDWNRAHAIWDLTSRRRQRVRNW